MAIIHELVIDNFAGGGGASTGIEIAIGRHVDIAINHDPAAIAMHKVNHPYTRHYCESVWDVDPRKVAAGRPVGLVWLSPDCKHFSKAKGGKPKEKSIRGLAWVAVRWAATVRPRVMMLENVEEFKTWGPLLENGQPDPKQKGRTFNCFVNALRRQGYAVETRELRACDYGAPTIRKRLFLIARRDGHPIIWPEPTHGDPKSAAVKSGRLKPWRAAAEIIDWSIHCPSIFERKRPLAENTLRRIARGIQKFVIDNPEPFIVRICHTGFGGDGMQYKTCKPLTTITTKAEHCLVTPFLTQYHSYDDTARGQTLDDPIRTIDTSNRYGLVAAFISKYYAGCSRSTESDINGPLHTIPARNTHALVTAHILRQFGNSVGSAVGSPVGTITAGGGGKTQVVTSHVLKLKGTNIGHKATEPLHTITAGGTHFGEVRAFLLKYYGTGDGQAADSPLGTVTTKDRFGLVTIHGEEYIITDIGMRMLQPRELYNAHSFPADYIIEHDADGGRITKKDQVAKVGNSVPPPFATALVRANLPEMCADGQMVFNEINGV